MKPLSLLELSLQNRSACVGKTVRNAQVGWRERRDIVGVLRGHRDHRPADATAGVEDFQLRARGAGVVNVK